MIGRKLRHYRIVEKLGEGGMGEVYRARDEHLDRDVAIKVLPAGVLADASARRRFRQEAKALSILNHPQIATIHDFDTEDGVDFLVMECIDGTTLKERLESGALSEDEVKTIGSQVAEALEEAHDRGVIHRDLKPSNIALSAKGRVKVLDFGLARLLRPTVSDTATTGFMTEELSIAGTLPYMAPEELRGARSDVRSDLYSLGVVLYEMATGRRPFDGSSMPLLADAVLNRKPDAPRAVTPTLSSHLEGVILKALEKDPSRRYQTARRLRDELIAPASSHRIRRWPIAIAAAGIALASVLSGLWKRADEGTSISSVAVLPLQNLSGDPAEEYFVDGMTDELIAQLAQVRALKVISRTSVMPYKNQPKPLRDIARELGVDAIVEGTVRRSGDRVRITAQLIAAPTDHHLWAQSFDRELRDVLTLQSEVARAIVREIRVNLTPNEESRLARTRIIDPEAYRLYLQGNFLMLQFGPENLGRARDAYQRAVELDRGFAPAYAGSAMAYLEIGGWRGSLPPRAVRAEAKGAIDRALSIDPGLADGYLALGMLEYYGWNWPAAEEAFRRGLELNPSSSFGRLSFANFLTSMGRFDESVALGRETLRLDPLSPAVYNELVWPLRLAGHEDEAFETVQKGMELVPESSQSHWFVSEFQLSKGNEAEAILAMETAARLFPHRTSRAGLGRIYALTGREKEAREILDSLENEAGTDYHSPVDSAWVAIGLGENQKGIELLNDAFEKQDLRLVHLKVHQFYDPLRGDPRFQDLLRRMNFPE
jgi:serine/threonine-protein kinase